MASAWEQAAEIQPVNQRLRQLQLSMAVGESLHARHLSTFTRGDDAAHRVAGLQPHPRAVARPRSRGTHADGGHGGHVPAGAGHAHGDAPDRQAARTAHAAGSPRRASDALARDDVGGAAQLRPTRLPRLPCRRSCRRACRRCRRWTRVVNATWNSGFADRRREPAARRRCRPSIRCRPAGTIPGHFRTAAADHLARIRPSHQRRRSSRTSR